MTSPGMDARDAGAAGQAGGAEGAPRWRVLIGKPGLDGHNRGVYVLVRALRDAGFEVIYTGIRKTPQQIASAALQEDVDAVGVSSLSGAHMQQFPELARLLREQGSDALLFCGGIIPQEDHGALREAGYDGIFGPGTSLDTIANWLGEALAARRAARAETETP